VAADQLVDVRDARQRRHAAELAAAIELLAARLRLIVAAAVGEAVARRPVEDVEQAGLRARHQRREEAVAVGAPRVDVADALDAWAFGKRSGGSSSV
jgi:hypothetical protein